MILLRSLGVPAPRSGGETMRNENALETPPDSVTIEVDGRRYHGSFHAGPGVVMPTSEVGSCEVGNCFAQRCRLAPERVAALLLRKLAENAATA